MKTIATSKDTLSLGDRRDRRGKIRRGVEAPTGELPRFAESYLGEALMVAATAKNR